ncbi:MAG: dihydroorotate dehydrogenase electron transfer subunit [Candidatus Omnitrophota bacterium]
MKTQRIKAKIKSNTRVAQGYYKLAIAAPAVAKTAKPGNFLMLKVCGGNEPLLRRPLSIHSAGRIGPGIVELLYEVVGPGTGILSHKKSGQQIDVIGPLGNGFSIGACGPRSHVILVAGGMGVAPLVFLAQRVKADKVTVLIGARTSAHILCGSDFRKLGCDVRIATDDGTRGFHGRVTGLLENILARKAKTAPVLYGCGPKPMLKAMSGLCSKAGVAAQISLESHMACGIGACLGCVVQTKDGFQRVCKEGPVFQADELVW